MRFSTILCMSLLMSCVSTQYPGIRLTAVPVSETEAELQKLARNAQEGFKWAQLELGKRYEAGDGVPCDLRVARRLYQAAATTTGGRTQVYAPGGGDVPGQVLSVDQGPRQAGLEEAAERLARLGWRCEREPVA
ncbi:SEL1-like repeat protein [Pacificimonas sp. WHA3]|uniref:SEL1-like repeat protein n=1 Tax=Pacificimonas pallii TaxID=2827236 RepID=A0ABS6SDG7_9SPHN|nr:SEL1-like repeat protein [Pacificimonas pallii]MBV7256463.1 SEL1-like repeat protein [Pacificimonas pallii]